MTRAIYLDDALNTLQEGYDEAYGCREISVWAHARNRIAKLPTIEAETVKHGKWVMTFKGIEGNGLTCSACKEEIWDEYGNRETNFCPNCGAKMDKEG